MSPSPLIALALLGSLIVMMVAVTNVAAYHQWRTRQFTDDRESDRESDRSQ